MGHIRRGPMAASCSLPVMLLAVILVAALGPLPATPAQAAQRAAAGHASDQPAAVTFPQDGQGIYESCDPHSTGCAEHLHALAQAGFRLVINYGQFAADATLFDQVMYAVRADLEGMRVIWPVGSFLYHANTDRTLAASYPVLDQSMRISGVCPRYDGTNAGFVACLAGAVHGLAGTWGYYIGDELPASREVDLRHLVDAIYDVDPQHPRLYVAVATGSALNRGDLAAFGRSYCDGYQCHPDATVIAQDFYPIGTGLVGEAAPLASQLAAGVQGVAAQNGVAYAMVLQAHSLAQYPDLYPRCTSVAACPYPTRQQMLAMRDAVLAHPRPQLLLWYSSFDLRRSDNYAQHWADLVAAVNQGRPAPPPAARTPTAAHASASPAAASAASSASAQALVAADATSALAALSVVLVGLLAFLLLGVWAALRTRPRAGRAISRPPVAAGSIRPTRASPATGEES